ncbi:hypothetical protein RSAG8_06136, partial [Rhizoctonia solani AG-8 WAC10335]
MTTVDLPSLAAQPIRPFESIPVMHIWRWAQVASAIREACIQVGFFYVKNHGVDEAVIAPAVDAARRFFDLPLEEKMKYDFHKSPKFKGYYPITRTGFMNEALDIRPEVDASDDSASGLDLWPPEGTTPRLREAVLKYYDELNGLGLKLYQAFALALNLPEDFFADKVKRGAAYLRLMHYPPQADPLDVRERGIRAHTDYQCFTILWQGEIPALQIKNASDQWINAQPMPGTFVINIADLLSRWTNDIFKSTVHRVTLQPGVRRISIPLFFGMDDDVMVEVLPSCVSAGRPARYEPIRTWDHVKARKQKTRGLSK